MNEDGGKGVPPRLLFGNATAVAFLCTLFGGVLDGIVLILTIVLWNYALDFLTSRFPVIERFTYPSPIPLVRNGQVMPKNMRQQFVTHEELMSVLREHDGIPIDPKERRKAI